MMIVRQAIGPRGRKSFPHRSQSQGEFTPAARRDPGQGGEAGYQTEAEKDGKGSYGWNEKKKTFEQDPRYTWQSAGFDQTDEHPVVNVSWNDAAAYCEWLSRKEGMTYRLPTEAEWEYACRAGTTTRYSFGDDPAQLAEYGWFSENSGIGTHPVSRHNPNAWGLYDMHGNVWEWCSDGYAADYYKGSPVDNPRGPDVAAFRVIRGGGWYCEPRSVRSACRGRNVSGSRFDYLGFRVARVQSVR